MSINEILPALLQILTFQNTFDRAYDEIMMEIQTENFFRILISLGSPRFWMGSVLLIFLVFCVVYVFERAQVAQ
jgi:hypothetical protein